MRRSVVLALVAISCLSECKLGERAKATISSASLRELTTQEIFEKYKDSVFTITSDDGSGTGFLFIEGGIITCFHVAQGSSSVSALRPGMKEPLLLSFVNRANPNVDAMIFSTFQKEEPIPWGSSSALRVGDRLVVIGSPQGLEQSVSEGILSGRRTVGGREYLQLSAPVSPGSSGSPVFDKHGKVVGMVTASLREGQQLNFAISIDTLVKLPPGLALGMISNQGDPKMLSMPRPAFQPLAESPWFFILVESIPKGLTSAISISDVKRWVQSELSRSAPMAKVLSGEELEAILKKGSSLKLGSDDDTSRYLYVNISFIEGRGLSAYSVSVSFKRSVITAAGTTNASVWDTGQFGYFGTNYSAEEQIKEAVQTSVRSFGEEWLASNKTRQ